MTYVIAEPCMGVKDRSCEDVCPVDCIHEGLDQLGSEPHATMSRTYQRALPGRRRGTEFPANTNCAHLQGLQRGHFDGKKTTKRNPLQIRGFSGGDGNRTRVSAQLTDT